MAATHRDPVPERPDPAWLAGEDAYVQALARRAREAEDAAREAKEELAAASQRLLAARERLRQSANGG